MIWNKLTRFRLFKTKFSKKNLIRLCKENSSNKKTLVIHSEDVNYAPFFPNHFTITKRKNIKADMHVDDYYNDIKNIEDESYEIILCTGLLEHLPDPFFFIKNLKRILKPHGKLIISASCAFSIHEGPDNYFHFTPYSINNLFKDWSEISSIKGASQPFETIGILLQRILIQCDIIPIFRPIIEVISIIIPIFDKFILRQFNKAGRRDKSNLIDSMLPSNIQAVIIK